MDTDSEKTVILASAISVCMLGRCSAGLEGSRSLRHLCFIVGSRTGHLIASMDISVSNAHCEL